MIFPRRVKPALLAALLAVATAGVTAKDAQAEDLVLKEATSMMGTVLALSSGAPGLVVAAVRGEESVVLGFGETRPGSKTEPNGRSVLRMGSIAKAMAGQVLASMAADGTVKITDPLAKYAPPGAKVPSFAGRQITLIDLATYTAGLPRELPDAPEPQPGQNPFTRFQTDAYWRWLSGATLPYAPGTGAMYSNLGFGLLGEALAKAGGKPYAALLKERVTDPHERHLDQACRGSETAGDDRPRSRRHRGPAVGNAGGDGRLRQRLHHRRRHGEVDALAPRGQ